MMSWGGKGWGGKRVLFSKCDCVKSVGLEGQVQAT